MNKEILNINDLNSMDLKKTIGPSAASFSEKELTEAAEILQNRESEGFKNNKSRDKITRLQTDTNAELPGLETHRGDVLKRYTHQETNRTAIGIQSLSNANVIAYGGWDFTEARHHSALQKSIERLFETHSPEKKAQWGADALTLNSPELLQSLGVNVALFAPSASKPERLADALSYNNDKLYVSNEMQKHADELWERKFLDSQGELIPASEISPLTFYNYSIGNRMARMVENALYDKLSSTGADDVEIGHYFNKLTHIGFAYAVDYQDMPDRARIPSINVFSHKDLGVMIPTELYQDVILKDAQHIANRNESCFKSYIMPEIAGTNQSHQQLVMLDDTLQSATYKGRVNQQYHGLFPYVDSVNHVANGEAFGNRMHISDSDKQLMSDIKGRMMFHLLSGDAQQEALHNLNQSNKDLSEISTVLKSDAALVALLSGTAVTARA